MAAAVALFFLARLTQVGWVYLLDSVLWGALLLSAVLPWLTTMFLGAQRSLQTPPSPGSEAYPSEGGRIDIQVTLRNRVFWPRFLLNLDYRCPPADPEHQLIRLFVAKLTGSRQARLTSTIELHLRGNHLLGPVFAESAAPFGLVRRRRKLTSEEPILVYPKVHSLARLPLADALSEAAAHSKQSRSGLEPAASRRYVSGDPRRHIHWRNTARMGQPMVKEFQEPSQSALHLVFDTTRVWGEGRETTLEYAIKIVASAAFYAHGIGVPVLVFGGGVKCPLNGGADGGLTWAELLRQLASVAQGDGDDLSQTVAELPPGSNVLVAAGLSGGSAVELLARATAVHQRLAVVSLEGFGEEKFESPEVPAQSGGTPEVLNPKGLNLESLVSAGAAVVRCQSGQLTQALDALGRVDAFPGPSSRHIRQTVPATEPQDASGTNTGRVSG